MLSPASWAIVLGDIQQTEHLVVGLGPGVVSGRSERDRSRRAHGPPVHWRGPWQRPDLRQVGPKLVEYAWLAWRIESLLSTRFARAVSGAFDWILNRYLSFAWPGRRSGGELSMPVLHAAVM